MIAGFSFVLLLALGAPIAFVLLAVAMLLIAEGGHGILFQSLPQQLFGGLENYGLLALPLFILLGEVMNAGGIGRRLMALALACLGAFRGGLAHVNLIANMMMAAILGSSVAQLTIMSRLAVPEMERAGYPRDLSVAITAAGGMLAPILPPSMLFIIFGVIAQIPVADLFVAGVVPGLVLSGVFFAVIAWLGRRHGFPATTRMGGGARLRALCDALPALLVPVVIVGAILGGHATPTEAAAVATLAAMLIGGLIYRELRWSDLPAAFGRAARAAALVLFLIAAAQVLGWVITFGNLPQRIAAGLQALTDSPIVFLLLLNLLLLAVGAVLDPVPAIILVAPVLLPVATGVYGIDPVQFGVILCLNLTLGLLSPPVGSALFTAAMLNDVPAARLTRLLLPFFLATAAVLLALVLLPGLSTGLGRIL